MPPRPRPRARNGGRRVALLVTVVLAALTLGPAPSFAATPTIDTTPSASPSAAEQAQPLCEAPAEGRFSCFALRRPSPAGQPEKRVSAVVAPDGYGPADLIDAYHLPADGGAGQTIAIVDAFDAPTAEADLAIYRAQYGLPACTSESGCFRKVDQRGGTDYPVPDGGWAGEIALDLDMVSAVAPRANLLLVEADSNYPDDLGAAVDQAVAMGAKFVSNSYGTDREYPDDATLDVHYNHPGVAIVASSGDYGYGVSYPAASPYVTAVGGTSLVRDSSARGWSETVWNSTWTSSGADRWGAPGSGCSVYGAKPGFQSDRGCAGRTVADVSAVADPVTGVAVYNSYSDTGWSVYGGTSASSPIIAGVYAIAGTPVQDTDVNSYAYANPGGLNDVVKGDNASCSPGLCGFGATPSCDPAYLCVAAPAYDGPTGLGTPNGAASFRGGPHGTIAGTVTDKSTKAPIAGALITFGAFHATSGTDGGYRLSIPAGGYTGTVSAYGYKQAAVTTTTLEDGATVTRDVALEPLPSQAVSGVVTDGGGHGWPMYAQISVEGVPGAPVHTDPATGAYHLKLPQGTDYTLTVTAGYPGYLPATETVRLGTSPVTANIAVPVDTQKAAAPGYTLAYRGGGVQAFDDRSTPTGWTVRNNNDNGGWQFDDPLGRGNQTGGGGGFAIVDDFHLGWAEVDTELRSPSYDLSKEENPVVEFETHFPPFQRLNTPKADVDVSTDGGATWTTVWTAPDSMSGPAHVSVPLAAFAGRSGVRLRFHYAGGLGNVWEIDKVAVGTRTFGPTPGGLVVGQVTDANTGGGVVGATVSAADSRAGHSGAAGSAASRAISVATPDDPALGDGLYWLFSPKTGKQKITAEKAAFHYPALTRQVKVSSGATRADFALETGRLTATPASVDTSVTWGSRRTVGFTVRNTGTGTATFTLGERPGVTPAETAAATGAAANRVKVPATQATVRGGTGPAVPGSGRAHPAGTAWRPVADLPKQGTGMVAGVYEGKLYAGLGNAAEGTTFSNSFASYDQKTGSWTTLTSPWYRRWAAAGAFIDGRFYVTSGRDSMGGTVPATEAYNPKTDRWQTLAPNPDPYGYSGVAALDGKLYLVGGCRQGDYGSEQCANNTVTVYDPAADKWSKAAPYPAGTAYLSCGGIDGKVYCAGGVATTAGYAYDPAKNAWSRIADMPLDLMDSAYAVANGRLLVSTGYSYGLGAATNEGYAYDPAADAWSPLPNADVTVSGAVGAPGFYLIGGTDPTTGQPTAGVERLSGYDRPYADVSWMSARAGTTRLGPGRSTTVRVTLDADPRTTSMLTDYSAAVTIESDTPYGSQVVPVTMRVKPPRS
ncbi:carboxypeptidase regulatory-like domain-containing protein [Planotetraspora mira]|uniref:carboxypeptidase regulatory-like domain-containing protein n=1 Tax=Planotetraspora mira TaxID=58121 RepID=UPI001952582B|nr:carboxypeptidase regulatory-like domain-containing protein [Planotetraspora mira]